MNPACSKRVFTSSLLSIAAKQSNLEVMPLEQTTAELGLFKNHPKSKLFHGASYGTCCQRSWMTSVNGALEMTDYIALYCTANVNDGLTD